MNTNQIRISLNLDYRTVKHHLDVLEENDLITSMGNRYGRMYFPSQKLEENIGLFEEIWREIKEVKRNEK